MKKRTFGMLFVIHTAFYFSIPSFGASSPPPPNLNPLHNSSVLNNRANDRFNPLLKRSAQAKPSTNGYGVPVIVTPTAVTKKAD